MLNRISSRELTEVMLWEQKEPLGFVGDDLFWSRWMALYHNAHTTSKSSTVDPTDYSVVHKKRGRVATAKEIERELNKLRGMAPRRSNGSSS